MDSLPQDPLFYVKVVAVVVLLVSLSVFWRNLKKWSKSEGAMNSPMSITFKTDKTPAEIAQAAQRARFERRVSISVILVVAWAVLYLFDSETATDLFQSLVVFLSEIVNALFELIMWVFSELSESAIAQ